MKEWPRKPAKGSTRAEARRFYLERWPEIVRRRKEGGTLAAIGREFNISRERVRQIVAKDTRRSMREAGVQPRVYVQQQRRRCSYCTGPMGGYETACRLCKEHGVLGSVLWGREAPWDFHAPRRKAARERSAD